MCVRGRIGNRNHIRNPANATIHCAANRAIFHPLPTPRAQSCDVMRTFLLMAFAATFWVTPAMAADETQSASLARGQQLMLRCQTCHAVKANAAAKVGPTLHMMFGRGAATLPGYTYSPAMRKSGLVWDETTLDRFLEKPSKVVPGTLMAFAGLPNAKDRAALVAWLKRNTR